MENWCSHTKFKKDLKSLFCIANKSWNQETQAAIANGFSQRSGFVYSLHGIKKMDVEYVRRDEFH